METVINEITGEYVTDWIEIRSTNRGYITGLYSSTSQLLLCKLDGEMYSPVNLDQAMSICSITDKYFQDLWSIVPHLKPTTV